MEFLSEMPEDEINSVTIFQAKKDEKTKTDCVHEDHRRRTSMSYVRGRTLPTEMGSSTTSQRTDSGPVAVEPDSQAGRSRRTTKRETREDVAFQTPVRTTEESC